MPGPAMVIGNIVCQVTAFEEAEPMEVGHVRPAFDGSLRSSVRAYKRRWNVTAIETRHNELDPLWTLIRAGEFVRCAGDLLAGVPLNSDPGPTDLSAWEHDGATLLTVAPAPGGTYALASLGPPVVAVGAGRAAVDPSRTYRVHALAFRDAVTPFGRFYLGVSLRTAAGAEIDVPGVSAYWLYTAAAVDPGVQWTAFSGTFGAGTAHPIPAGAATMAPLVVLNADVATTGFMYAQEIRIDEVHPGKIDAAVTCRVQLRSVSFARDRERHLRDFALTLQEV